MRLQGIAILIIVGAAIAVSAAAAPHGALEPLDQQKAVVDDHRNGTPDAGPPGRVHAPGRAERPPGTFRQFQGGAPPWGEGQGLGPNRTVPAGPAIDLPAAPPTAAPGVGAVRPGVRFGQRRYLVGASPLVPPIGNATVPGRALGMARNRSVLGTGAATGLVPPRARFVRWSPAARWRPAPSGDPGRI